MRPLIRKEDRKLDLRSDYGPSLVGLIVVRLLLLALAVATLRFLHREWHTASFVVALLGAAFVLGRDD